MTDSPPEALSSFLARQPGDVLIAVLLELARDHEAVQARLDRLRVADQPDKLAADFRKTLDAWKRSSRYYGYREADEFVGALERWIDQIELYMADQYGARDELLRSANLLLDEAAQRALVAGLDARLSTAVDTCPTPEHPSNEIHVLSGALSLLAKSLRDPDVTVRALLRYRPDPNPVQRQSFARAYLEADRPVDALVWLQDDWGPYEANRLGLLAEALEQLGQFEESVPIRRGMFERTLSVFDLELWLRHLSEAARRDALDRARELALEHPDPTRAATILAELGDFAAAEARLLAEPHRVDGGRYGSLVPLARALREHDRSRGETVIYRALLRDVLDRGQVRAYGHAARYWARLREIANSTAGVMPLSSHDAFEAEIRASHGRKRAFWAHVNGSRRDRHDVDDDT